MSPLGGAVAFSQRQRAAGAIAAVATLDLKADEPAVNALAANLGVPLRVFPATELEAMTPQPPEELFSHMYGDAPPHLLEQMSSLVEEVEG